MDKICSFCLRKEKVTFLPIEENFGSFSIKDRTLSVIMGLKKHSSCNHKFCGLCVKKIYRSSIQNKEISKIKKYGKTCKLCKYLFNKHVEICNFSKNSSESCETPSCSKMFTIAIETGMEIHQIQKILICYEEGLKYLNENNREDQKLCKEEKTVDTSVFIEANKNKLSHYRKTQLDLMKLSEYIKKDVKCDYNYNTTMRHKENEILSNIRNLFLHAMAYGYYNKSNKTKTIVRILADSLICMKNPPSKYVETLFKIAKFIDAIAKNKECEKIICDTYCRTHGNVDKNR
jgi:hypothetical protein